MILEGHRLLKRNEEQRVAMLQDLRKEILVGIRQLDTGKSEAFNDFVVSDIKVKGRVRRGLRKSTHVLS